MAINATPLAPEADPRVTRPVTVMNPPDVKAEAAKTDVEAALAEIAKIEAAQAEAEAVADAPEGDTKAAKAKKPAKADAAAEAEASTAAKKLKDDPTPERDKDGKFVAKGGTAEGEKERKGDEAEKEKPEAKEAKPKEKEEPEAKPDRKAAQFARKAEEDRRTRAADAKHKADAAKIEADRKALAEEKAAHEALKKDPLAYLKAAGYELDDVLRHTIAGGKKPDPTPEEKAAAAAEARVQAILAERDKQAEEKAKVEREAAEQRRTQENQQRVQRQLGEARKLVDDNAEKYPVLHLLGQADAVVQAHYHLYREGDPKYGVTPGTIVPLDKVAEMLESELDEEFGARARKVSSYLGRYAPQPAAEPQVRLQSPGEQVRNAAPNAISQRRAAPIATPSDERRELSDDDRILEAAKLLTYTHEA